MTTPRVKWLVMNQNGTVRIMPDDRIPGMVRLDPAVRGEVDQYANDNGISYNAAMNILVRAGLRAARATAAAGGKR